MYRVTLTSLTEVLSQVICLLHEDKTSLRLQLYL